jgi:hypothetical protein
MATGRNVPSLDPASNRHRLTVFAPFQLTYTDTWPGEVRLAVTAGRVLGVAAHRKPYTR